MFHGDRPLGREILDLLRPIRLPVLDVRVRAHAQRPPREDDRAHIIVEARRPHRLLMRLRRPGLLAQHEPRADPHGAGAEHQRRGETLPIEQPARGNDLHVLARQRAFLALAHLRDGRDQDRGGHVAGVAAAFAALGADQVGADGEAFRDVFGVADHVHVEDAGVMQAGDDVGGRDADGGDEEFGARVDDDGDEVVEFAFGVVVAVGVRRIAS